MVDLSTGNITRPGSPVRGILVWRTAGPRNSCVLRAVRQHQNSRRKKPKNGCRWNTEHQQLADVLPAGAEIQSSGPGFVTIGLLEFSLRVLDPAFRLELRGGERELIVGAGPALDDPPSPQ